MVSSEICSVYSEKKFRKSVDFRNRNSEWAKISEFSEFHPIPGIDVVEENDNRGFCS